MQGAGHQRFRTGLILTVGLREAGQAGRVWALRLLLRWWLDRSDLPTVGSVAQQYAVVLIDNPHPIGKGVEQLLEELLLLA